MKVVVLAVALTLSGFAVGQNQTDSLYNSILNSISIQDGYDFKEGDYDAPQCIGLLQYIFEDDITKYKYKDINPRIGRLRVYSSDTENEITFNEVVELYLGKSNFLKYFDTTNYYINYGTIPGVTNMTEFISIIDKQTNFDVFSFSIIYDKLDNMSSNEYLNLGSMHVQLFNGQ